MTQLEKNPLKEDVHSFNDKFKRLIESINNINPALTREILNNGNYNPDLVVAYKDNSNPILSALKKGICIVELSGYIYGLQQNGLANKSFEMNQELMKEIAYAITHPVTETHPNILLNDLIKPLFTPDSFEDLKEEIDVSGGYEGWLASYYT